MSELAAAAALALWFGVLTSISPCPLATNIAAISYIGRKVGSPGSVLVSGLLYTAGRSLTYAVLAAALAFGLLSAPYLSHILQKYMLRFIGPLLILVAMILSGMIGKELGRAAGGESMRERADRMGIWGAALLGVVFALSFCPTSAALFFGSLLPLTVRTGSLIALPLVYGIGTALPVVAFAFLLAAGTNYAARAFDGLRRVEIWARRITAGIFFAAGIWFTLRYTLHLF